MFEKLSYSQVLQKNRAAEDLFTSLGFDVSVLSNVTVNMINDYLELGLRNHGLGAKVSNGDYDNIVQESQQHADGNVG